MSIYLLLLFIPPFIVVLLTKVYSQSRITPGEMAAQFAVPIVLVVGVWNISMYSILHDTEIRNGQVTNKASVSVTCSHTYDCHCRTETKGSGKDRRRVRICDTCRRHSQDWDWRVYTTVGNFDIPRIDSQGYHEPPRWSSVYIGQPSAREYDYVNYIRAAPDSLLHISRAISYKGALPAYPTVFDYQHTNHVMALGTTVLDIAVWNQTMAEALRDLGPKRQVNVNLILTNTNPIFSDALRKAWMGGKKNDVTIVVGTNYPKIRWVRVFSWAKYDLINVALRSDLLYSEILSPETTVSLIAKDIDRYYRRRPMADFEYLAQQLAPPLWVMILALVLSTASAVGLGILFHQNDFFPTRNSYHAHRRQR